MKDVDWTAIALISACTIAFCAMTSCAVQERKSLDEVRKLELEVEKLKYTQQPK